MMNCFFCHKPVGTVVATLTWTEWAMKQLETIREYAHLECLERARKNFTEADAA